MCDWKFVWDFRALPDHDRIAAVQKLIAEHVILTPVWLHFLCSDFKGENGNCQRLYMYEQKCAFVLLDSKNNCVFWIYSLN